MLDMFHEAVTSGGVSSDRQHFHGLCKAVDMSASDAEDFEMPCTVHWCAMVLCTFFAPAGSQGTWSVTSIYIRMKQYMYFS